MDAGQVSTVGQTQAFDCYTNNSHYVRTACCVAVHQRIWQWCVSFLSLFMIITR